MAILAIIKCPECGNEVSDKSKQCIHCGYPLQENMICNINGRSYDLSFILDSNLNEHQKMTKFNSLTGIPEWRCKLLIYGFEKDNNIPECLSVETEPINIPKCPTCGSTNIEKISVGKKMRGSFLFGVLSSDVRNTMHCKNCGYKW